ncbi:hypothetical protein KXD40_005522 [Peronospora effusa]|nr:hypothetical protein KXD40_005521 [Peronospora effusa]UIZ27317.1 hypothetical protein KXD40_005522 [Peronospora effusa]
MKHIGSYYSVQASFSSDTGFRRATPTSHTSSFRLTLLNQVRCTREVVDSQDWLDAHEDKRMLVPPQCRRERQQLSFRCHCFDRSFAGLMYHGDQGNGRMVLEAGVVGIGLVRGTLTYVNVFDKHVDLLTCGRVLPC